MMAMKLPTNLRGDDHEFEGEREGQPVNPMSQSIYVSPLSVCINCVIEFEEAITEISLAKKNMADALLPTNPLWSCIMNAYCNISFFNFDVGYNSALIYAFRVHAFQKKDDRGVLRWQRTTVNIDDHVYIPEFPPAQESYDACVDDYISKLAPMPLDQSRPLWECHLLNYKTNKAGATLVIKIHHSLGDGISLMSTLFSIVRRVDNPDLPPTFPTASRSIRSSTISKQSIAANFFHIVWYFILLVLYTTVDVISSALITTGWIDDSQLPIRGPPGVEHMAPALSSATFLLEDIRQIKNSVGGTVNDVITAVIFYGMQRYLEIRLSAVGEQNLQDSNEKRFEPVKDTSVMKQMKKLRVTALCLLNTRVLAGIQSIDEMLKPKTEAPWGNHFALLPVRVPIMGKVENPLEFVTTAKRIMDRHKMSLGVFINARIMRCLYRLKGPQATFRSLYNTIANTTVVISNMIGPMEKIAMNGNAIKSFSFFVSGTPTSLYVSILSYMGTIKIQVTGPKAYTDVNMLSKCFTEAFEEIKEASIRQKM